MLNLYLQDVYLLGVLLMKEKYVCNVYFCDYDLYLYHVQMYIIINLGICMYVDSFYVKRLYCKFFSKTTIDISRQ